MSAYANPMPAEDPLTEPFWAHARERRLAIQQCRSCGHAHFPPSPVCPECLSEDQTWQVTSGRGTLESWVVFHRAYWDTMKDQLPYDVCLVRLDEGPLILSNFSGGRPDDIRAGMRVQVCFDQVGPDFVLPRFRPA